MIDLSRDFPMARRVTYLNSASISLMPGPAVRKMRQFEQVVSGGGTVGFDEKAETDALEGARLEGARLLGARTGEVAVLSSATDGICSFALSLNLKKGANVVSTDADFPSVVYPWMRLRAPSVRLVRNRSGVISESELEHLVDRKTSVISISHVEYGTGQRFDLRWLSELAHSHGANLIVDATQSAGLVPIDVHRDGIDALVAGGYKGLLGPFGAAIFYLRRGLVDRLIPPFVGWRSAPVPYDLNSKKLGYAHDAKKFEYSTMSYSSAIGLAESMRYLRRVGYHKVTEHVSGLARKFLELVKNDNALPSRTILTPEDEKRRSSIVSVRFRGNSQLQVSDELIKRKVIVSRRFNAVRFSFHVYNTPQDLVRALNQLHIVLKEKKAETATSNSLS
jgi:cysteine desulfurase/selenocysteine lyase